jgi:Rod binding domain-containing protein
MIERATGMTGMPAAPSRDDPVKVADAVRQFEALMIGQLLKSARSSGGWFGTGEDQAGQLGVEMAEQEFARMLAASGGLGLAKLIAAGLQTSPPETTPPATPARGAER